VGKGIVISLIFYIVGLGLAGLSYVTVGHEYIHGPGLHHLIIVLTFISGFLWMIVAATLTRQWSATLKGIVYTNLAMSVGFGLFILYLFLDVRRSDEPTSEAIIEVVETDSTTTMYRDGTIIYVKEKDSVLLNFIDSTRIDWDKVEFIKK